MHTRRGHGTETIVATLQYSRRRGTEMKETHTLGVRKLLNAASHIQVGESFTAFRIRRRRDDLGPLRRAERSEGIPTARLVSSRIVHDLDRLTLPCKHLGDDRGPPPRRGPCLEPLRRHRREKDATRAAARHCCLMRPWATVRHCCLTRLKMWVGLAGVHEIVSVRIVPPEMRLLTQINCFGRTRHGGRRTRRGAR